jgi:hypothetical protein
MRNFLALLLLPLSVSPCWGVSTYAWDLSEATPANAALRSALVPGWGQWFNSERQKGAILGGATLIATGAAAWLFVDSHSVYNDYTARGVPNDPLYDRYKNERTSAFIALGAASIGYLFGIFDAYKTARDRHHASQADHLRFAVDTTGHLSVSYGVPF